MKLDSLIFEDPPVRTFRYPLQIGSNWIYRSGDKFWRIEKKVVGKEVIEHPLGNFHCYLINWLYDINKDGQWDEDVQFTEALSKKGLIYRKLNLYNIEVIGETGAFIGLTNFKEEYVLESYILDN